ncbi:MAG: hypothetical protein WBA57_22395 [Elainellaceae cyanobacterium]
MECHSHLGTQIIEHSIENPSRTDLNLYSIAIAKAQSYSLSRRESKVWLYLSLCQCVGYTHKQMTHELFIATDTVKKHFRSINAKRDRFHGLNCDRA